MKKKIKLSQFSLKFNFGEFCVLEMKYENFKIRNDAYIHLPTLPFLPKFVDAMQPARLPPAASRGKDGLSIRWRQAESTVGRAAPRHNSATLGFMHHAPWLAALRYFWLIQSCKVPLLP